MTGFALALLLVAIGFLVGYAVGGLTVERRLRRGLIADLEGMKADAEERGRGYDAMLATLDELEKALRVPR